MSKRSKKDRSLPPAVSPLEILTPSTVLKVGETFIVLRRAPNKNGVTDESCLATVVEIREGEQASISSASICTTTATTTTTTTAAITTTTTTAATTTTTTLSPVNYLVCFV